MTKHLSEIIKQLNEILEIISRVDKEVLNIYRSSDINIRIKKDNTPVTKADLIAHEALTKSLSNLFPSIPIVSEEGDEAKNHKTIKEKCFWLIDPIDGTNEFINETDEFTICVALIEENIPTFGIVSAPALGIIYYGGRDIGSFKITGPDKKVSIHVPSSSVGVIIGSHSGFNEQTKKYIKKHYQNSKILLVGSQLKLSYVAEGKADSYPRLGSSMRLWDLAAGQAILEGAGGSVKRPDGSPIDYHLDNLLVGDFVASN